MHMTFPFVHASARHTILTLCQPHILLLLTIGVYDEQGGALPALDSSQVLASFSGGPAGREMGIGLNWLPCQSDMVSSPARLFKPQHAVRNCIDGGVVLPGLVLLCQTCNRQTGAGQPGQACCPNGMATHTNLPLFSLSSRCGP